MDDEVPRLETRKVRSDRALAHAGLGEQRHHGFGMNQCQAALDGLDRCPPAQRPAQPLHQIDHLRIPRFCSLDELRRSFYDSATETATAATD